MQRIVTVFNCGIFPRVTVKKFFSHFLIRNIRSHDVRKHTLVTRMREMVSFEFVKEMEKDVFRCVFDERERKKSLSPHEESNLIPADSALRCSTTEPQRLYGERRIFIE